MQLVCTSKNIWTELSYEFGPICLINLGRVGMGGVLIGPSWHGPSWFWAELSIICAEVVDDKCSQFHCKCFANIVQMSHECRATYASSSSPMICATVANM